MKTTERNLLQYGSSARKKRILFITRLINSLTLSELEELQSHIKAIKGKRKEKCPDKRQLI